MRVGPNVDPDLARAGGREQELLDDNREDHRDQDSGEESGPNSQDQHKKGRPENVELLLLRHRPQVA